MVEANPQYFVDHLDTALAEGWVQLYHQPIVRTANGRVCDEEALARWVDPTFGFLTPDRFIPAIEEAGLLYKLDLYMLEQVLAKMQRFKREGLYIVPESINLSRSDFDACDMVEEIRSRVDAAGIERRLITVEITESMIGSDFDFVIEQVNRFHDLGFSVWMDDFGSEYSSLDNLQRVRFDLIKLDRGFMREFERNEKSRIILTEIVRMAIALGVDTVVEGVETQEQVDFLREIGVSKLQGFYFCKPVSTEQVLERYETGIAIGFENPKESTYFSALGKINLYNLSSVVHEDLDSFDSYFDSLPMAVVESDESGCTISRCNVTFRDFIKRNPGVAVLNEHMNVSNNDEYSFGGFIRTIRSAAESGDLIVVDEPLANGLGVRALVRRVAQNPVTGTIGLVIAVLSITGENDSSAGLTFAHVARALSADYLYFYYVDLATDRYIEYYLDSGSGKLETERYGDNFFEESHVDALSAIYEGDVPAFLEEFTKEKILKALDRFGKYTIEYRLLIEGSPIYVNLKATRISKGSNQIIIGVSNVDVTVKERKTLNRMREERTTFERVAALAGNFICMYVIDPVTHRYTEYNVKSDYAGLELPKMGEDFFAESLANIGNVIYPEDLERFNRYFNKPLILTAIEHNGLFRLRYRLVIDGEVVPITLRIAQIEEYGQPKLVAGVVRLSSDDFE